MKDYDNDSGLYTDKESARRELAGIFSNEFSNIALLRSSEQGPTEIHAATRYGKRFILKGLKLRHREDPVCNMCMAKEFEIGIALDHPNIRRTVGLESIDGLGKRIILEYIDGLTLGEVIAAGTLSPEKAVSIAIQLADALRYLHSKQICHRDLKPGNILVPYQGDNVKVIDFNLSDRDDFVVLKNPAGSKRYMAPELADPDCKPTPETDCYSLGIIVNDLADATSNRRLHHAAALLTHKDPKRRKEGLAILEKGSALLAPASWLEAALYSKALTYVLSAICLLLSTFITLHYLNI